MENTELDEQTKKDLKTGIAADTLTKSDDQKTPQERAEEAKRVRAAQDALVDSAGTGEAVVAPTLTSAPANTDEIVEEFTKANREAEAKAEADRIAEEAKAAEKAAKESDKTNKNKDK